MRMAGPFRAPSPGPRAPRNADMLPITWSSCRTCRPVAVIPSIDCFSSSTAFAFPPIPFNTWRGRSPLAALVRRFPWLENARLRIAFNVAQAHTEAGQSTVSPRDRRLNCPNLWQLVTTCDFEGKVEFVAGLDVKRPYRVVELQNPTRLVIDIKH